MALITLSVQELASLSGVAKNKFEDVLTRLGVPLERLSGDEVDLEITPNRPDLLSVEGVARAMHSFSFKKNPQYAATSLGLKVFVDKSVLAVRPFIAVCVIKDVKISAEFLKSLINLQEKLHDTLGRKRKKVAIGVHDGSKITFPLTYKAVSPDWEGFIPLDKTEKMAPMEILKKHEKGIAYAHLVPGACPIILDSNQQVLSFPPIINGELTRVSEKTTEIILDVTGTSQEAVSTVLNIIACCFADRKGKIVEVKVASNTYPQLQPKKYKYPKELVRTLLGLELSAKKKSDYLEMMGYSLSGENVLVPPYRLDIINEIDIVEDIAIAHGLNNFPVALPAFYTEGKFTQKNPAHDILTGMGFLECTSWVLTCAKKLEDAGCDPRLALGIKNKLTEDFSLVRPAILPNLLDVLAQSKDEQMPQKIYELGPVWAQSKTIKLLSGAVTHPKASFSEAKGVLKSLFCETGLNLEIKETKNKAYIDGRCALILVQGKPIGIFGEVHPQVLNNFGLEQPVAAFELEADALKN